MIVTGINIVRNCIETGYPFIESILSALPLCDYYYVNDGGSTDGTLEALIKLREVFPNIKIFQIPDRENVRWDCISDQINIMIQHAERGVLFLGNADELIHEKDIPKIKELITSMATDVLRFDRMEIKRDWSGLGEDVYHPARIARNYNNIRQDWNAYGGDEFLYDHGWPDPDRNNRMGIILYHFYNMFPENKVNKLRNDAEYLAPGDKYRVDIYEVMKDVKPVYRRPDKVWGGFPVLARGFPYMPRYYVRECLFNKEWLSRATGLDY